VNFFLKATPVHLELANPAGQFAFLGPGLSSLLEPFCPWRKKLSCSFQDASSWSPVIGCTGVSAAISWSVLAALIAFMATLDLKFWAVYGRLLIGRSPCSGAVPASKVNAMDLVQKTLRPPPVARFPQVSLTHAKNPPNYCAYPIL